MHRTPIKVLSIGHSYVLGVNRGAVREAAKCQDLDITVAAPESFRGDLHRHLALQPEPAGSALKLVGLPARLSSNIHFFHYSTRQLNDLVSQDFDLIHAWEEPYILAGYQIAQAVARARKLAGDTGGKSPRFCFRTAQSLDKNYPPPFQFFEQFSQAQADGWINSGELVRRNLVSRGYAPRTAHRVPLAVDTALFRPLPLAEKTAMRAELGLDAAAPMIAFVGRLTREKGVPFLLESLDLLRGLTDRWTLLFLGSGPEEARIRAWTRENGLADRVRVRLARHEDVGRCLGAADVLAAPSQTTPRWKEQFGRMLIEAFAAGVPVIGSDSGEIPHVIGDAGLVVHESDARQWAEALAGMLLNPARRAELARRGLSRAQQFSAEAVARDLRTCYLEVMEQPDAWRGISVRPRRGLRRELLERLRAYLPHHGAAHPLPES